MQGLPRRRGKASSPCLFLMGDWKYQKSADSSAWGSDEGQHFAEVVSYQCLQRPHSTRGGRFFARRPFTQSGSVLLVALALLRNGAFVHQAFHSLHAVALVGAEGNHVLHDQGADFGREVRILEADLRKPL